MIERRKLLQPWDYETFFPTFASILSLKAAVMVQISGLASIVPENWVLAHKAMTALHLTIIVNIKRKSIQLSKW